MNAGGASEGQRTRSLSGQRPMSGSSMLSPTKTDSGVFPLSQSGASLTFAAYMKPREALLEARRINNGLTAL